MSFLHTRKVKGTLKMEFKLLKDTAPFAGREAILKSIRYFLGNLVSSTSSVVRAIGTAKTIDKR